MPLKVINEMVVNLKMNGKRQLPKPSYNFCKILEMNDVFMNNKYIFSP